MTEIIKRWYLFLNRHTVSVTWFMYLAPALSVVVGRLIDTPCLVKFVCLSDVAIVYTYMIGNAKGWNRGDSDER